MARSFKRLRLHGFNNLTKSLSFNLYDVCYARGPEERRRYIEYLDEEYNAERLTAILTRCTEIIGANILNIARQDYEPEGASVTILISEGPIPTTEAERVEGEMLIGERTADCVVGHLDKSHICVHTYPEAHPDHGIATFRADIEVSTCGEISPLHALDYLIREFDSDVISIDYRVRGFTRDVNGRKHWIDHRMDSIQHFIDRSLLRNYQAVDVNFYQENTFHTKLMWKAVDLDRYLFGGADTRRALNQNERRRIKKRLAKEIQEIYYGRAMA
ncbi:MAG: adenosylmethionine decarboxylase [Planctomycetota bacterium]